ncbi:hypothetical protein [Frankia gtarii]|uniref:hypothetical protein n=1 Tax=Frankia gtarii TaxID=2950102 RepID=UPI0021BECE48|nr:hypothetical protein [Frankia gtarii]
MGLPDVSRAHTLVRMGGGAQEGDRRRADRLRAAFLASFLDAAALPPGMCRIRPPDAAAAPSGGRTVHQGRAIWLGTPDAELYRLDDTRWLLPSPRRAGELARELPELPATPPLAGAGDDPPGAGHVSVLQVGPVVARLQAVPGEGSALPDGLAADLGRLVAQQISVLAGAALDLRRPAWHPARWISRPGR